jgi:hypothetical protein
MLEKASGVADGSWVAATPRFYFEVLKPKPLKALAVYRKKPGKKSGILPETAKRSRIFGLEFKSRCLLRIAQRPIRFSSQSGTL